MTGISGYFDHNATTPLAPAAREAWLRAQEEAWQNPSSLYPAAGRARRLLEDAREQCAELLGCEPGRVVFTSGATEGNNAVLRRAAAGGGAVVICAVEHPAVREPAWQLCAAGRVRELPVDPRGAVEPEALRELLRSMPDRPGLVSVMAANNETGVVQPWPELAALCAEHGVSYHCDAAQWVGKRPAEGMAACTWITVSAHKFGGPKGVGVLVIPAGTSAPLRLQAGGPQESGHRGGTEDYPSIAAMVAALAARGAWVGDEARRQAAAGWRDAFERRLGERLPGARVVGEGAPRLETTSLVILPRHGNLKWVTRLGAGLQRIDRIRLQFRQGNPSPVLQSMGVDPEAMEGVLRCSAGPETVEAEWEALLGALLEVWDALESGGRDRPKMNLGRL